MPWCPKCREEYRPEFKTCADCDAELVDELSPLEEKDAGAALEWLCDTRLTTTEDLSEAEVIESYLRGEGIPVHKVVNSAGVNLLVPEKLMREAYRILGSIQDIVEETGRQAAEAKAAGANNRQYRRRPVPTGDAVWCPICRAEYRRGYKLCADCGAALTDSPPEDTGDYEAAESSDEAKAFCDAHLLTAADFAEAEKLEEWLNEGAIPVALVTGGSGVGVYVPEELLEEARDILTSIEETAGEEAQAPPAAGGSGRLWCPNCRLEYWQSGVTTCRDCGARLVDPAARNGQR